MEELSLKEVALAVGGTVTNAINYDLHIKGVSIDSRKIGRNEIFIAIRGSNMDGHDYVEAACKNGAVAAIVSRIQEVPIPQILVEDTSFALKSLAQFYRNKFDIPVIGVTGSTGKTSTKEIIAAVLETSLSVHKTILNFNNEIGLPLTIFELDNSHEISILEMGMNNLEEIKRLANISKPSIGVITNIGTAHIENLGSRENILKAKMEITTYFEKNNILVINSDDDYLSKIESSKYGIIKVSMKNNGDYNAFDVVDYGENGIEFKCLLRGEINNFRINVPGKHNIYNALCAIALGDIFNIATASIKAGLENYKPVGQRMNIINLESGIKILSDCYNANPDSMKAAIDVLESYNNRRRIAVLGDMYELGEYSREAHRETGTYLKGKCEVLIAIGKDAEYIYNEIKNDIQSVYFKSKDEAKSYITSIIKGEDVILIKASNGMKLVDITNYLLEDGKKVK